MKYYIYECLGEYFIAREDTKLVPGCIKVSGPADSASDLYDELRDLKDQ